MNHNETTGLLFKDTVVNVASVPHRSPFRYPGGKTWLVPKVREWLASVARPMLFIEPFAGGAITGLTVAFEELADRVLLVEKDKNVAAIWQTILGKNCRRLIERVEQFPMSHAAVKSLLNGHPRSIQDRAFQTLVRNRVQHGGILAPGASLIKNGENGKGIGSRWYPQTIARRLEQISERRTRIGFCCGDAFDAIQQYAAARHVAFFIDPPYTVAGRRLYLHSEIDHPKLFAAMASVKGDFLMTYDNCPYIQELAQSFGFDTAPVAMKNTHHEVMSELLVGRNLSWWNKQFPKAT
jgi:DNA adenine methylase